MNHMNGGADQKMWFMLGAGDRVIGIFHFYFFTVFSFYSIYNLNIIKSYILPMCYPLLFKCRSKTC